MSEAKTPQQVEDEDGLTGVNPELDLSVPEGKAETGLDYVSKSRIKTFVQCPRKFWYKYWTETRPPTNYYMTRGSQVHETFEDFHESLAEYVRNNGARPDRFTELLGDRQNWAQWVEMIGRFFLFEERRWQAAAKHAAANIDPRSYDQGNINHAILDAWEPVGVEVEGWLGEPPDDYDRADPDYVNDAGPPVGEIPWMGHADVILPTESVPEIDGDGVVILDYKTGSVPDEQYRDEGIFLEGEFYGWLFDEFFDVDGVAGYYPQADELIVSPYPSQQRRWDIKSAVLGMQKNPDLENYPVEEQPLCHYGHGKCFFYDVCPSRWNE